MSTNKHDEQAYQYIPGMSRRESLKWLSVLAASAALPGLAACTPSPTPMAKSSAGHWPDLKLAPISASGYGKDPNLIIPPTSAWPRTLSAEHLSLVAVLADILVPRDGDIPSASEVKVPEVIDEWVSAPYETQQRDRPNILATLVWIDDEAALRFNSKFVALNPAQQLAIMDDIAYRTDQENSEFSRISGTFNRFRQLVLAAFFCSPQGTKEIGYLGNVPIAGDYPGPSDEAMNHLNQVLTDLGLSEYEYTEPKSL